ncbi:MAG: DUF5593 domain-containing protein [Mycobacterium sp.]|nr:DUF5593 domain-containing protein [Mycobacterium sp.]
MAEWLLVEVFGGHRREPTVLAKGNSPQRMVPLRKILVRPGLVDEVLAVIARVAATAAPVRTNTLDQQRQIRADPLSTYGGRVHGVWVWVGGNTESPPQRGLAGAWHINVTRYESNRSDDLFDLYGTPKGNRPYTVSLAQLFGYRRLQTNSDESSALAKMINSRPGDEHQATWTVTREDTKERRAANFAFRTIEEPGVDGNPEVIARGISHDIGPADSTSAAPPETPMLLAERVVAAERTPGEHRAIVNLHTLRLVRWLDDPYPDIAWEIDRHPLPAIHREDLSRAMAMSEELAHSGRVTSSLRFRAVNGDWMRLGVVARLMILDQHTTAALVTLSEFKPGDDKRP